MKPIKLEIMIAAGVLILSALACNLGSQAPTEVTQPQEVSSTEAAPQQDQSSSNDSAGACDNPYSPIVQGATWNYNMTGGVADTFVHSIVSIEADSFTEQDVFGTGITRTGYWSCDDGALTMLDPRSDTTGTVAIDKVTADFKTTSASGITLPATLNPDDEWEQAITLEGTEDIGGNQIPAKNEFSNSCKAIGAESVTVPAGTFDAMRVDCQTTMNITITMANTPVTTALTFSTSSWFVENIGLVKESKTGDSVDSVIELTSYNIP